MLHELVTAARVLAVLTLLTGLAYPLLVTGLARACFPHAAGGSLVDASGAAAAPGTSVAGTSAPGKTARGSARGSALIGQPFTAPGYLWGRPSATADVPCNASASGGSNLGPTNPALVAAVSERIATLAAAGSPGTGIPIDLVTASASGLDPHISPAAAEFQVPRVARARGLDEATVRGIVRRHTLGRQFGLLGEPRVNVLLVNLDLDRVR